MKRSLCLILLLISTGALAVLPCEPKTAKEKRLLELAYVDLTPEFQKLIAQGANPNVCDKFGASLLILAATWDFQNSAGYPLTVPKVDVDVRDSMEWTAIAYGVARSNFRVVDVLAHSPRTSLNVILPKGQTIFHVHATAKAGPNHEKITQTILPLVSAELLNHRNDRGLTSLHLAIKAGNATLVKDFLKVGLFDLTAVSPAGLGYTDFARDEGQYEIATILESTLPNL